jgi:hypothetical protein
VLIGGVATTGVGAVIAGGGAMLSLGARDTLTDPKSTGADKTSAAEARPTWALVTIGGGMIALTGAAIAVGSLFVE